MRNAVQQRLAANILLMRKGNRAFLLLEIALEIASLPKNIHWKNKLGGKLELGCRKISWFVSVSQINYLPQPSASANTWSVRHRQITIFCSTSSNNCYFLFLKPRLGDFLSTRLCAYKLYLLEILYWNHTMLIHYLMAQNVSLGCLQEWMKKISV